MFNSEILIHAGQTFLMLFGEPFAVIMGLVLDAAGFEDERNLLAEAEAGRDVRFARCVWAV